MIKLIAQPPLSLVTGSIITDRTSKCKKKSPLLRTLIERNAQGVYSWKSAPIQYSRYALICSKCFAVKGVIGLASLQT